MKKFNNNIAIVPRKKYFYDQAKQEIFEHLKLAKWLLSFQTCIGIKMVIDDELNYDEDFQLYWLAQLINEDNKSIIIFGSNNKKFREKYFNERAFKIFIRKDWEYKNQLAKAIYKSIEQINLTDELTNDLYYLVVVYETLRKYSLYEI